MADLELLAALRPGDPHSEVIEAFGPRWRPPRPHREGVVDALENSFGVVVRITRDDRVGEVRYNSRFDRRIPLDGLRIGMSVDEVRSARPEIEIGEAAGLMERRSARLLRPEGVRLSLEFFASGLVAIEFRQDGADYPSKRPPSYPPATEAPGHPFRDPNLKLVVLDRLLFLKEIDLGRPEDLAAHLLGRPWDYEEEG